MMSAATVLDGVTVPKACPCCDSEELKHLWNETANKHKSFYVIRYPADFYCGRCFSFYHHFVELMMKYSSSSLKPGVSALIVSVMLRIFRRKMMSRIAGGFSLSCFILKVISRIYWPAGRFSVEVPIIAESFDKIISNIHSAHVPIKGNRVQAHSSLIHHINLQKLEPRLKDCMRLWYVPAIMAYARMEFRVQRWWESRTDCSEPSDDEKAKDAADGKSEEVTVTDVSERDEEVANPDCDEVMIGSVLDSDAFGVEQRVHFGTKEEPVESIILDDKVQAIQIAPDLVPVEVMRNAISNTKCALAKRVQPLEFKASVKMQKKIARVTSCLIKNVFKPELIKKWREEHSVLDDLKSSKWNSERFRQAFEQCHADFLAEIEQVFQTKSNEALPANSKAPRNIIQSGDRAQIYQLLPVKCFEDILFEQFESASIKHQTKYDAMHHAANWLRLDEKCHVYEGDGKAWDACCTPEIRNLTENRIISHIINILGEDPDFPKQWFDIAKKDMKKKKIRATVKCDDALNPKAKVKSVIDAIRQSGGRGTSCFNWLINFVCWVCVLMDDPVKFILQFIHNKKNVARNYWYVSPRDNHWYKCRFIFEGDDSAVVTSEKLNDKEICEQWEKLGFRMDLVTISGKGIMNFCGYHFLCDDFGPTSTFMPEVRRNLASSSWSASPLLISAYNDGKLQSQRFKVGASAMYARAENFKDCGPMSAYFAELGLAHIREGEDFALGSADALYYGVEEVSSIKGALEKLRNSCEIMTPEMRELFNLSGKCEIQEFQEVGLLNLQLDTWKDTVACKHVLPTECYLVKDELERYVKHDLIWRDTARGR